MAEEQVANGAQDDAPKTGGKEKKGFFYGWWIVIGGFMTANERPVPAICISVGRGLVLQSAVLLLFAAVFGGEALWYTPILSEAMCLCLSLVFLRSYRREHAA